MYGDSAKNIFAQYMFDFKTDKEGCITIAGDPLVKGEWYNGHLANTAMLADPTSARSAWLLMKRERCGAPPELLAEWGGVR